MQVIVQVSEGLARALHERGMAVDALQEIQAAAEELGVSLQALHPGTDDPALGRFLAAEVPDQATGERVADVLRHRKGVEGAYLKPPDALP